MPSSHRSPSVPERPTSAQDAENLALELFIAGYEGTSLPSRYADRLRRGLAGVILFSRNLEKTADGAIDTAALTDQTADVHALSPTTPLCAVDQEGGLVARLRAPFTHLPPMRDLGDTEDLELLREAGRQTAEECLAAGFNVDFAPILDIDTNSDNPIIGRRAFGATAAEVITRAGAFLEGLQSNGVMGCGKHFPGHGDTDTDSHLALPVLPFDRSRLEAVEMAPFRALASRLPMVMTAHVLFPALDPKLPATLSQPILEQLLRGWCGFHGLIVSDDLEMKGVADAFSFAESTRRGLAAGVDVFLVCRREDALDEAVDAAAQVLLDGGAAGQRALNAVANVRSARAKAVPCRPTVDAVQAAIHRPEGVRLRNRLGIGNV